MDETKAAKKLALFSGVVSETIDYVANGHRIVGIHGGALMMQIIAAIGACCHCINCCFYFGGSM